MLRSKWRHFNNQFTNVTTTTTTEFNLCILKWPWQPLEKSNFNFWSCSNLMKLVTDSVEFSLAVINHPCHVCMQKFIQIHERIMSNLSIQCMDVGVNYVSRGLVSSGLRGSGGVDVGAILGRQWRGNLPQKPFRFWSRIKSCGQTLEGGNCIVSPS